MAKPFGWRDGLVALALFLFALAVFRSSPVSYVGDSKFSMLLSHQLLTRHVFTLDDFGISHEPPVRSGSALINGGTYQLELVDGHLYYYFPPGTSLLSVPFVAVMEHLGEPLVNADGSYNPLREIEIQVQLAALLMAALTVLFYFTGRLLLPVFWSFILALGGALGTPIWSTASRAMWTHTWGVLLLGMVVYWLLAWEMGRRRGLSPVLLASALSWAYFVRPTSSIFIVGVTVYLLLYHRRAFLAYAVTGAMWFGAFVAYSWSHFGRVLPSYYQAHRLVFGGFWEGLAGNLFSPSRGLFVLVPVLLWIGYLVVKNRRQLVWPRLVWLALAVCAGHLAVVSCFVPWNGGSCFGPRYSTELIPWLVLLAALGLHVGRRGEMAGRWAVGGVALAASIYIHGRGAASIATALWNERPVSIFNAPERVWDWRYPQFLAGMIGPPLPAKWPQLPRGHLAFGAETARAFQFMGWSDSDADSCWTDGPEATLIFATDDLSAASLRCNFRPNPRHDLPAQRVEIILNGQSIATLTIEGEEPHENVIPLPPGALRAHNILNFKLPDAAAYWSPEHGYDQRLLGIDLYWLELDRGPARRE